MNSIGRLMTATDFDSVHFPDRPSGSKADVLTTASADREDNVDTELITSRTWLFIFGNMRDPIVVTSPGYKNTTACQHSCSVFSMFCFFNCATGTRCRICLSKFEWRRLWRLVPGHGLPRRTGTRGRWAAEPLGHGCDARSRNNVAVSPATAQPSEPGPVFGKFPCMTRLHSKSPCPDVKMSSINSRV